MTDGLPALALAIDPADSEIMKHKPRPKNEGVVNKKTMILIGANGLMLTAILLAVFYICLPSGIVMAQTAVFTGFVIYEFLLLASIRREEKLTLLSNKWLLAAVAGAIALQLFVVYGPFSGMFGVTALGLFEWSVLAAGFAVGWIVSAIINHFVE
jgi:Ca2+-transporting ATPase